MGLFPKTCQQEESAMPTADLNWLITRGTSSFLLKRSRISMSREPNNLKSKHSFRYSGIVNKKTVGVEPCKDGKGVVLITKKKSNQRKPGKNTVRVEMKRDSRRKIASIRKVLGSQNYRKDLVTPAIRRACAIIRSQRPVVIKRQRGAKKD